MKRTRFEASIEKRRAVKTAEAAGEIADSLEVRLALLEKVKSGEITLDFAKKELKKIQNNAKKVGQTTRAKVFSES